MIRIAIAIAIAVLSAASLVPSYAYAALEKRTVQGLTPSSNVTAVYDTATRLEWLAPDATFGMGVNAVLASDFVARGFRYASGSELIQLVEDAGFDPSIGRLPVNMPDWESISGANLAVIKNVIGLLGPSSSPNWLSSTSYTMVYARLGDIDPHVNPQYVDFTHKAAMIYAEATTGRFFVGGAGLGTAGNYLVREVSTVPEPGTAALLAAGLLGFTVRNRRR